MFLCVSESAWPVRKGSTSIHRVSRETRRVPMYYMVATEPGFHGEWNMRKQTLLDHKPTVVNIAAMVVELEPFSVSGLGISPYMPRML
jgi:hypothetical protein